MHYQLTDAHFHEGLNMHEGGISRHFRALCFAIDTQKKMSYTVLKDIGKWTT